jgi:hypothetical protein
VKHHAQIGVEDAGGGIDAQRPTEVVFCQFVFLLPEIDGAQAVPGGRGVEEREGGREGGREGERRERVSASDWESSAQARGHMNNAGRTGSEEGGREGERERTRHYNGGRRAEARSGSRPRPCPNRRYRRTRGRRGCTRRRRRDPPRWPAGKTTREGVEESSGGRVDDGDGEVDSRAAGRKGAGRGAGRGGGRYLQSSFMLFLERHAVADNAPGFRRTTILFQDLSCKEATRKEGEK